MLQGYETVRKSPIPWRLIFGLKLIGDAALAGVFYFQHSLADFWKLGFILLSLLIFLGINAFYLNRKRRPNWLLHVLLLDFLISAAHGYAYISGDFPNHLSIGITALAILMVIKGIRRLIAACLLLLAVYVATMGGFDWHNHHELHITSYFISCSFILFAGIVSAVIQHYQRARENAMQLYAMLMQSHEQLAEYARQTEEWAATRERVRIARDIHDTVGHKLTALLVQMQLARKLGNSDSSRSQHIYLECEELVRSSLQEVRLSVRAIREEPAGGASLVDSIEKLCAEFTRFTGVRTAVEMKGVPVALPRNLQLTAYRIAQECLTNAQKHGDAKHVNVALAYSENEVSLHIWNDGVIPQELKPGFGLISLQERAREWNGEVRFIREEGEGFAVQVALPYSAA
ncbi:signal transduction histidine kinase [Paenibacillus phyllosphaerae]|uniref:histidine kinase n=1 Tax=Paenibacillus phyllosphaerae TaxID=274593 RepID=A0A7W5B0Y7_9BACL|nr:sensor histidine kinase [Paenibacillus phyllosphaerae]MBB3112247.1 signal transduction histidine kinase [Paenibacillus phyllosphaerae]